MSGGLCPECGTYIGFDEWRHCPECGAEFDDDTGDDDDSDDDGIDDGDYHDE